MLFKNSVNVSLLVMFLQYTGFKIPLQVPQLKVLMYGCRIIYTTYTRQ